MTTTGPEDCIYDVTPEELAKDKPVKYAGGITAELTPDGKLVFTFKEPRHLTEVKLQTPDGIVLQVVPESEDGTKGAPTPLDSNPDEPATTELDEPKVLRVTIEPADGQPALKPEDILFIEVTACEEGKSQ